MSYPSLLSISKYRLKGSQPLSSPLSSSALLRPLSTLPSLPLLNVVVPKRSSHHRHHHHCYPYTSIHAIHARAFSSGRRRPGQGRDVGRLASLAAASTVLLGKTKWILAGLKLTKMMPLVSMVGTSFAYSFFFGWPYAVGMVGLTLIHETGHAVALRYYNIPFNPMVMVPFMGAVIVTKEMPRNAWQDAAVAYGGPALGSAGALGCAVAASATDSQLLYALADFGYMINLFNLLPIGSMDGGRIAGAIHPSLGALGVLAGGGLIYAGAVHNPIFYLILGTGAYSSGRRLLGYEVSSLGGSLEEWWGGRQTPN